MQCCPTFDEQGEAKLAGVFCCYRKMDADGKLSTRLSTAYGKKKEQKARGEAPSRLRDAPTHGVGGATSSHGLRPARPLHLPPSPIYKSSPRQAPSPPPALTPIIQRQPPIYPSPSPAPHTKSHTAPSPSPPPNPRTLQAFPAR